MVQHQHLLLLAGGCRLKINMVDLLQPYGLEMFLLSAEPKSYVNELLIIIHGIRICF